MNETVAFDSLFNLRKSYFGRHKPLPNNCLIRTDFFGIIKHLSDLTSSNIQLIVPVQNNIGLSFASPSITLSGRNKLDVGLGLVQ